jgi:serine protease inhibitor
LCTLSYELFSEFSQFNSHSNSIFRKTSALAAVTLGCYAEAFSAADEMLQDISIYQLNNVATKQLQHYLFQ